MDMSSRKEALGGTMSKVQMAKEGEERVWQNWLREVAAVRVRLHCTSALLCTSAYLPTCLTGRDSRGAGRGGKAQTRYPKSHTHVPFAFRYNRMGEIAMRA